MLVAGFLKVWPIHRHFLLLSQFEMETPKIGSRRPCAARSVDDTELGHFTLLFCRERHAKKRTKIYNARAPLLFCSLNLLFGDVLVAVVVVRGWFSSLLSPGFVRFLWP